MSESSSSWLPRLDPRLACVASQVPACNLAADIGADHGKLSCWLLASGRAQRMLVSDISKTSRDKARDLLYEHELLDRVLISGEDGLHALAGLNPEVIIIAGMGGGLVSGILRQQVPLEAATLVISAHTELPLVREALNFRSYRIERELVVFSSGRYYRVMTAVPGTQQLSPREMALGPNLAAAPGTSLKDYLEWQMRVAREWQGEKGESYRAYLREELDRHAESKR